MQAAPRNAFGIERLEAMVAPAGFCATLNSCAAAWDRGDGFCWNMLIAAGWGSFSYAWAVCQAL
jgi:hypothetical protein